MPNPIKKTREEIMENAKNVAIQIMAKFDNGSHGSNQLQGADEAIVALVSSSLNKLLDTAIEAGPKDKYVEHEQGIPPCEDDYLNEAFNHSNNLWRQLLKEGKND